MLMGPLCAGKLAEISIPRASFGGTSGLFGLLKNILFL
uniref:Uncharacterized protein n=1 Tax=Rhizophora mucronata TaxID=61149 RepID=A0A2P2NHT6_RHIMU